MAQTRRKDTRQRIQQVALELFLERGYDQTSLREIAEGLDVTKAALYYHFKTKEDIVVALAEQAVQPVGELVEWAQGQPRTRETKREILSRLNTALDESAPIFRFLHENQAALRGMHSDNPSRDLMGSLHQLIAAPDAPLPDAVRVMGALFTIYFGTFALDAVEGDPAEKRAALLQVAGELLDRVPGESLA